MSEIDVTTGEMVTRGQLLGRVGHTGLATGAHLHWEVELSGVAVDPERLFQTPVLGASRRGTIPAESAASFRPAGGFPLSPRLGAGVIRNGALP